MRDCFRPPIPEIDQGIDLLRSAADALLKRDLEGARQLIVQADIPAVSDFYSSIAGKSDWIIHKQVHQPKNLIPRAVRALIRMPTQAEERAVFLRDGWHCRFCSKRVISRHARKVFLKTFPTETHWVDKESERHATLHAQAASLDHILPHCRGGDGNPSNLVTACGPCQFGRNCWTLEEVQFNDPRERPPIIDGWNGLTDLEVLGKPAGRLIG